MKQTKQRTTVYSPSAAEQIVSSTLFRIRKSESISIFKSKLLSFIRPVQTSIYNIFDPKGLTFLTGLRLGLSHLNEDRFRHDFQDCVNPICSCSLEIEDTSHYFLHCHHFSHHCIIFMNSVKSIILSLYMVTHDFMKTKNYFEIQYKLYKKKWKDSLVLFLFNVSLLNNVQFLTNNSDHCIIIIFHVSYC